MPIHWRSSAEVFAQCLGSHGLDAAGVADVEAAWQAFCEFVQVEIDGVDPDPDSDADGFIVQWGRYSWHGHRPSLTFTRQPAIVGVDDRDGRHVDREYWQVSLEMRFDDGPDLAGIGTLPERDTGFNFAPIGRHRHAALAEMRTGMDRHPQLQAAWRLKPAHSELTVDRAD
ncbi:hypothetical protein ABTX15_20065 [Micromonospora sp. NPDC094482]|uniref:hypothetical protein n=1 Tax=unclassified Micromonospora TaxID=2617518 RepID=UPI003329815B